MNKFFFEYKIEPEEFITGNSFIDVCEETGATFCKTDFISDFLNKKVKIFVTHNSDYEINESVIKTGPEFNFWFAQNKNISNKSVFSIPIGLENTILRKNITSKFGEYSSQVNGAIQKIELINKISNFELEKKELIYMNFNIHTFPIERQIVYDTFKDKNWIKKTSNLSIEKLYFDIASHKFVISPRGNGIDCHRTWEALYLKTIPIVKRSHHMNDFIDLPIFFVDSWSEITEESLNEFYEKSKNIVYNLDKLKISYWKNLIKSKL